MNAEGDSIRPAADDKPWNYARLQREIAREWGVRCEQWRVSHEHALPQESSYWLNDCREFDAGWFGKDGECRREQFVYFAQKEGYVKIGISNDVPKRVYAELGADLLFTEKGGFLREQELHRRFADCSVDPPPSFSARSEWFLPDAALREYITARTLSFAEQMAA